MATRKATPRKQSQPGVAKLPKPAPTKVIAQGGKPSKPFKVLNKTGLGEARIGKGALKPKVPRDGREERAARRRQVHFQKWVVPAMMGIGGLLVAALVLFVILKSAPVFVIQTIKADPTTHLTEQAIANLIEVPEGTTLLNVDTDAITKSLEENPWVGSVSYTREFPGTLSIHITERSIKALVVLSSSNAAWYLGEGNIWIQPVTLTVNSNETAAQVGLVRAQEEGELLISNVPASVNPAQGSVANDAAILAVENIHKAFSEEFASQVVSYAAPTETTISCTLKSGVEIQLGAASQITAKEQVIEELMDKYNDELTYINVRTPTNPSYRKISGKNLTRGSGE